MKNQKEDLKRIFTNGMNVIHAGDRLYSVKYTEPHVLRVDFRFEGTEAIDWNIKFKKEDQ